MYILLTFRAREITVDGFDEGIVGQRFFRSEYLVVLTIYTHRPCSWKFEWLFFIIPIMIA